MKSKEKSLAHKLGAKLSQFDQQNRSLPGIRAAANRNALIEQLIESIRRIRFVSLIDSRALTEMRADPTCDLFDPLRAAILHKRKGDTEEAWWLVFLFVHFGKHRRTGWRLARDIYGGLGRTTWWSWQRTSMDPHAFCHWLASHEHTVQGGDGVSRHFGNHRKYETLKDSSARGTGKVVESYVSWVLKRGSHSALVKEAQQHTGGKSREMFDYLYHSMEKVLSFGRTARFDYLTMIGKLGLAPIEPGSTYMQGSTGPLKGARLLFGKKTASPSELDAWLVELEARLRLFFGMQVLEDALCNWQKSPKKFKAFRG